MLLLLRPSIVYFFFVFIFGFITTTTTCFFFQTFQQPVTGCCFLMNQGSCTTNDQDTVGIRMPNTARSSRRHHHHQQQLHYIQPSSFTRPATTIIYSDCSNENGGIKHSIPTPDSSSCCSRGVDGSIHHHQPRRRRLLEQTTSIMLGLIMGTTTGSTSSRWLHHHYPNQDPFITTAAIADPLAAWAAPPIAVIADELGYYPVRNRHGDISYIPRPVRRHSSDQAIQLAQFLTKSHVVMYGAYWCPHCLRQRELFGREAWNLISYQECATNGYQANVRQCQLDAIAGFPTWKQTNQRKILFNNNNNNNNNIVELSGERSLTELAQVFQYPGPWRDELEINLPPPLWQMGSSSCQ